MTKKEKKPSQRKVKYQKSFNELKSQVPGTDEYYSALQDFKAVFFETSVGLTRNFSSLLNHVSWQFGISVDEYADEVACKIFAKVDYFYDKLDDADNSYGQLAKKISWMVLDQYRQIVAKNITGDDEEIDGKDDKGTLEENLNFLKKHCFVSKVPLNSPVSGDAPEGMTYAEQIPNPMAIDPEFKAACQEFLRYVLQGILVSKVNEKLNSLQYVCYLNSLSGQDNKYLVNLINDSESSSEVMSAIADSFKKYYGITADALFDFNFDLPRSFSLKSASNRLIEARRIIDEVLKDEHETYKKDFWR